MEATPIPAQREIEVMLRSAGYTDWPVPNSSRSRRTVGDYEITVTKAHRADHTGRLTGGRHVWFTILVDLTNPDDRPCVVRLDTKVEASSITEPLPKGFFHDYTEGSPYDRFGRRVD